MFPYKTLRKEETEVVQLFSLDL